MKRTLLLLLGLLALIITGCQAMEVSVSAGRQGTSIEISVSEEELNAALAETVGETENGVVFTPTVAFDDGTVTLHASLADETGASAELSLTFLVTQEDNQLRIYATQVTLSGADSAGAQVLNLEVALNRQIAAEAAGQTGAVFEGSSDSIYVESIEIVSGEMTVTIRLPS